MGSNRDAGLEAITANRVTPISTLNGIQASLPNNELSKLIKLLEALPTHLDRFESLDAQFGNRTTTLAKAIDPLTRIYSTGTEFAEIRKKANGKRVPYCITDWVLSQFMGSSPPRMPSKSDVFRRFGREGPQNNQLEGGGDSVQTFGRYLTVIRKLLEEKGQLLPSTKGGGRKRARDYDPSNKQHKDVNQRSPYEQVADLDDAAHLGLTNRDTRHQELDDGQAE
jgi:hypothetical protein